MLGDLFVLLEVFKSDPGVQKEKAGCLAMVLVAALIAALVHLGFWLWKGPSL